MRLAAGSAASAPSDQQAALSSFEQELPCSAAASTQLPTATAAAPRKGGACTLHGHLQQQQAPVHQKLPGWSHAVRQWSSQGFVLVLLLLAALPLLSTVITPSTHGAVGQPLGAPHKAVGLFDSAAVAQQHGPAAARRPVARQLLLSRWSLLGLANTRLATGGILQQLLSAADQQDEAAATAAKAAATSQASGQASRLLLRDLGLDPATNSSTRSSSRSSGGGSSGGGSSGGGSSGDREASRFLATAAQGPSSAPTQSSINSDAQPLCSATVNYGASVGDASKKATADVPIYVGSFDVVVTQNQGQQVGAAAGLAGGPGSRWVLGWQFSAGEYLQLSRDVFGDDGIQEVYMAPSMATAAEGAAAAGGEAAAPAPPAAKAVPQRVAVFSNTSLEGPNAEVLFSFVGRKGPEKPVLPNAPFRVAPPSYVFLNNHYCWPLLRPQAGSSGGGGGGAPLVALPGMPGVGNASGSSSSSAAGRADQQQQDLVELATPRIAASAIPKQLQVDYLPVEFVGGNDDPALFAKNTTQFYFKITNLQSQPVYLDQLLLQYWFHGPLDGTVVAPPANASDAAVGAVPDPVALVSASQFRLTCSDASPEVGCGGLAWNVTPGLPNVFGARYVLNIWFPSPAPGNATATFQRVVLLPPGSNSSQAVHAGSNSSGSNSSVGDFGLADFQAIVAIEPRPFFANISAVNDYSYLETPALTSAGAAANSSSSGDGKLVRRRREPNTRMPAYISQQLAWGSPPIGGKMAPRPGSSNSSTSGKPSYPPGSYCQPSPNGGQVCGVDVLYCCLGSGPLNLTAVPADWLQRLSSGTQSPGSGDTTLLPGGTKGIGGSSGGATGSSSSLNSTTAGGPAPLAVALAVSLPTAALVAAAVAGVAWAMRRRRARKGQPGSGAHQVLKPPHDGSSEGTPYSTGGMSFSSRGLSGAPQGSHVSWAAAAATNGTAGPSLTTALLPGYVSSQQGSRHGSVQLLGSWAPADAAAGAGATGLDAAEAGHAGAFAAVTGMQQQQQPAAQGQFGAAGQQALVATGMQAQQGTTAVSQQQILLRMLRPKANSLPADVIGAAVSAVKQQQQQQQQQQRRRLLQQQSGGGGTHSVSSRPSSPFAEASQLGAAGEGSSRSDDSDSDSSLGVERIRCHTWTGLLHEDAFEDGLLDLLLNLHMQPSLAGMAAAAAAGEGAPPTTDGVWQQLQQHRQQQQPQPHLAGGAAAAAVEAAVAAINALLTGSAGCSPPATPGLSHYPPTTPSSRPGDPNNTPAAAGAGGGNAAHGAGSSGSGSPSVHSRGSPSFYKALMATGGVLRPPGGPPIPLNVDFATEVQPYLGRLLGRGGFGHVYEGTWRGQRVAVKLLTVDTEDPAVLDAFLKEVALCACLRGCDRVVRLLGACLGACRAPSATQQSPSPAAAGVAAPGGSTSPAAAGMQAAAAAAAGGAAGDAEASPDGASLDITPFQSQLPPDVLAGDTPSDKGGGGGNGGGNGVQQPQPQQQWALIMELVEGGNLAHRIYNPSKRKLSYLEILQVGLDIAAGLAYLHPVVVHRDLKPQNVLLDKQGRAKIADFGISRFKDPHRSYLSVTHQGGTPNYMAPETFNANRVDEAADVYSLGCILYECLARQQPFQHLAEDGKSFNVLFKIIVAVAINKERPVLPHDTPPRLASLILRCWSENPAGRPRITELQRDLDDMMKEALQEHAVKTGRLARLSSRSQSLPNQPAHFRTGSSGSISSAASSANGHHSPRRSKAVRGALTLPVPGPPNNSLASAAAAAADGLPGSTHSVGSIASLRPAAGSGAHSAPMSRQQSDSNVPAAAGYGVPPLPSIGSAIAARPTGQHSASRFRLEGKAAAVGSEAAGSGPEELHFSLQQHTAPAAAAAGSEAVARSMHSRSSSSNAMEHAAPSSPRPFHDQQLLLLQQEHLHTHLQQQPVQHNSAGALPHNQQQQQQLWRSGSTSVASSCHSRSTSTLPCGCCNGTEPCAACAGSTSSSDACGSNGSSDGVSGSSGGSTAQHTPGGSSSPLQLSPTGARHHHLPALPHIPQDTPLMHLAEDRISLQQLPGQGTAAGGFQGQEVMAAAAAALPAGQHSDCQWHLHTAPPPGTTVGPQPSSLQPLSAPSLRPKASVASPQTPAQSNLVGRKGSQLSSNASGPHSYSRQHSLTPAGLHSGPGSSEAMLLHSPLGHTSGSAGHTPGMPLHTAAAALFSGSSGSSGAGVRLRQQQSVGLYRSASGGLPRQPLSSLPAAAAFPVAVGAEAATVTSTAAATATAGDELSMQHSGGLPRHRPSSSSGSNGSVLRGLSSSALLSSGPQQQQLQQHSADAQQQPLLQEPDGHPSSSTWQNQHSDADAEHSHPAPGRAPAEAGAAAGAARAASILSSSLDRSVSRGSSLPVSEQAAAGDASSADSKSSSPSAVAAAAWASAGSMYSLSSAAREAARLLRPSGSFDCSSTSVYINPLFAAPAAADSAQPGPLQWQHSAPMDGSSGSTAAAAAAAAPAGQPWLQRETANGSSTALQLARAPDVAAVSNSCSTAPDKACASSSNSSSKPGDQQVPPSAEQHGRTAVGDAAAASLPVELLRKVSFADVDEVVG